nr:hypothetical protein [uncultured Rhodopila sp.]
MSINGISGLSVANLAAQTRTHASGQTQADPYAATPPPPAAATAASPPGAASGNGTVGALSPSVLAALMGQDVNLTAGSFAGA